MTSVVRTTVTAAPVCGAWIVAALAPSDGWAAEAAATAGQSMSSAPLTFRQDDFTGFPLGGAIMLALLVVLALLSWWLRRPNARPAWLSALGRNAGDSAENLQVRTSHRLDAQTRLFVVRWKGRDLLIAAGGPSGPVVLDRSETSTPVDPTP